MANPEWTEPSDWGVEPANEAEHFITCDDCGQAIDCRDLAEVLRHERPDHEARRAS